MELKAENVKNIRSLAVCKELLRQAIELNDQLNEELRHHKYKRCLAMARWCMARYNEWSAFYPTTTTKEMKFLDKWEKRWRKLAEQFKEAKCR